MVLALEYGVDSIEGLRSLVNRDAKSTLKILEHYGGDHCDVSSTT
jgi:hypothetical protein